mmetsp:Transcript_7315/g.8841  ORF Transcript_7315/g.8841 Transcript_7315/m.8841 type:complete len:153 (-) Transcript_7315:409-867(-)
MKVLQGDQVKVLTNAFIIRGEHILLGMKKKGFGEGKFNGFGGKVEPGETPLQGAQRELLEEANIKMVNPKELGIVYYKYEAKDKNAVSKELKVHIYIDTQYSGEIRESEEMRPEWIRIDSIPFNKQFTGYFHFEKDMKTLRETFVEPPTEKI